MFKHLVWILVLTLYKCKCGIPSGQIDITIDFEKSDEEDTYDKEYKNPSNSVPKDINNKYENLEYNLIKVSDPSRNTHNEDIYGFLQRLRKLALNRAGNVKAKKPIYRQAITLIANSAEKDHQHGTRKLSSKNVPKMYMPIPQAISHILGKEHIPYGVYENLSRAYNYKAK